MFTATADLILPSTTTGSFPRPRWYDLGMWGRPLDTCMLDIRFREKFQDAMAVVISDQERAGLDVLSHGDLHVDEDLAGRAWHHYPLQRWAGFAGDHHSGPIDACLWSGQRTSKRCRHEEIHGGSWSRNTVGLCSQIYDIISGFSACVAVELQRASWLRYPRACG